MSVAALPANQFVATLASTSTRVVPTRQLLCRFDVHASPRHVRVLSPLSRKPIIDWIFACIPYSHAGESGSDDEDEDEGKPPTAAEEQLNQALAEVERITLDMRLLQVGRMPVQGRCMHHRHLFPICTGGGGEDTTLDMRLVCRGVGLRGRAACVRPPPVTASGSVVSCVSDALLPGRKASGFMIVCEVEKRTMLVTGVVEVVFNSPCCVEIPSFFSRCLF